MGGYTRLFGVAALGHLMSRVQGTVISAGSELERLIWERVNQIDDLDRFLVKTLHDERPGIQVATKKQVKESQRINSQYEPDFLAFEPSKRKCYVVEVKDGDQFDTKKAAGEHTTLHNFTNDISQTLPFSTEIYICSFNAETKDEIYHGLKRKFSRREILTGKELCDLLGIDYDEIVAIRERDRAKNLDYFVTELLKIAEIKDMIVSKLKRLAKGE